MAIMKQQVVTVADKRMSEQQNAKKEMTKTPFDRTITSLGMLYNVGRS